MPTLPASLGERPPPRPAANVASLSFGQPGEASQAQELMGASRQFGALGNELHAEFLKEKRRIDEAKVEDAFNTLRQQQIDLTIGDQGFKNIRGGDAVKQPLLKSYSERFSQVGKTLADGLDTPEQKAEFQKRFRLAQDQLSQGVLLHVIEQKDVYHKAQTRATIDVERQTAATHWNSPADVMASLERMNAAIDSEASRLGMDATVAKDLKLTEAGKTHAAIIGQAVASGNYQYAQAWLTTHKGEMSAEAIAHAENAVKTAGVKDESLRLSMGLTGNLTAQRKTLDELFTAGKIGADVRDATLNRIEHDWQQRKAQQAEGEKALLGNAYDWVLKNPGASVMDMPTTMYNGLKNTGHLSAVASFSRVNGKPETDDTVYYGLRQMAANEPEAFAQLDLLKSRDKLAPHDWQRLVEAQSSIAKGDAKAMQLERVVSGAVKSIRADVAAAGIDMTPKEGSPQAKQTAAFMSELHRTLDEAQRKNGGPLSPDEARKIGLGLLKEGWIQGSGIFFDDKVRRFQTPAEQRGAFVGARYGDIPSAIRIDIEGDLRRAGRNPTRAEVERIYQRAIDAGRIK